MLAWMIYVGIVTLLLTLAALCAEHTLRLRRQMTRWVWLTTIIASLIVPATIASVSIQVPAIVRGAPGPAVPLRNLTSVPLPGLKNLESWPAAAPPAHDASAVTGGVAGTSLSITLDEALERGWLIASGALLCVLLASGVKLGVRARRWRRSEVAGVPVYIAAGVGPAVVGLIWPRIVLPPWVLEAPAERQALVLAHEQAHLQARDPLVLTIALGLLVFMPWNLPLWWQLRQIRRAIEVDCDARVLRAGHDVGRYGEALIEAGERQCGHVGAVAAMAEHRSFMEERIRIMLSAPGRGWGLSTVLVAGLAVSLLALAVQVSPPPGSARGASSPYDAYVGAYRVAGFMSYVVRHGTHLYIKPSRLDQELELLPVGRTEFYNKELQGDFDFKLDARGHATAVSLRQGNGQQFTWPRVEEAAARAFESAAQARVQNQMPAPGSEAALRKHWASMVAGTPDYEDLTPPLAQIVRGQITQDLALAQQVGAIQSVRFIGVGFRGQDVYDMTCEHDTLTGDITFAPDGKISILNVMIGPAQSRPPLPRSEAAIRKHWASLLAGKPDYEDLVPMLAEVVRQQLPKTLPLVQRLGPIRAMHFRGVSKMGEDVYDALYDHGNILTWHVITDANGKLTSSNLRPGPGS